MIDTSFKIMVEGQSLTIKAETLNVRDDSNSFTQDFKAPHSKHPFLLIRNELTSKLLKIDNVQTVGKKRVVDCQVQQDNIIYPGKLTILEVFTNTIKCDLLFYSAIFPILSQKIGTFMPVISVIGDPTPDPYVAESSTDIDDSAWDQFSLDNKYNAWPAKDFCLPWIEHKDRFGEDLSLGDEWFYYAGTLNRYFASTGQIVRNSFADLDLDNDPNTPTTREFFNRNVVVPCVFLLAPITKALSSIGYRIEGDFINDSKVQKTFIIPKDDQMSEIFVTSALVTLNYDNEDYLDTLLFISSNNTTEILNGQAMRISYTITNIGSIDITLNIDASNSDYQNGNVYAVINLGAGSGSMFIDEFAHDIQGVITGSLTIDPTIDDIGKDVYFIFVSDTSNPIAPVSSLINIQQKPYDNNVFKIHPTIELSRFTPDVTVADYINEYLKNWHNLHITIDDVKQIVYLDYNEVFINNPSAPVILKDLYIKDFIPNKDESFYIYYAGEDAESILIDSTGVVAGGEPSEATNTLELKVKPAPHNGTTTAITSEFLDDSGTSVALYNTTSGLPYTTTSVNGNTLSLQGAGGMYESNFKVWLRFRINASTQKVEAAYSSIQLQEIRENGKVYFNNQLYLVSSIQYTEGAHVKRVTIDVESVNF